MTNFKGMTAAIAMTLALGISAFADCPARDGIIQSPPCAATQLLSDESATQTDVQTTLTEESAISLTEATIDVLQSLLTIF